MRYPLGTSGEPTQGGAAVAFIVSLNPRILEIEPHAGIHTTDIMDFWRPANLNEAMLNGKMSAYNYLKSMNICVARYFEKTNLTISDINHICFHAPFGKMAQKANNQLAKHKSINDTLIYNAVIGNSCSASIFICFISLLDHINENLTGQRIGFFSYGSGSVAEFFSGIISENYKQMLRKEENHMMLSDRIEISMSEYESFSRVGSEPLDFHKYKNVGNVALDTITNYQRIYLCHE
jgi:hydroxymethylglutaryl-CoA synthase